MYIAYTSDGSASQEASEQPTFFRIASPFARSLRRYIQLSRHPAVRPTDRTSLFLSIRTSARATAPAAALLSTPPTVRTAHVHVRSLTYIYSLSLSLLYFLSSALSGLQNRSKVGLFISSSRTVPQLNICTYFNLNSADVFNRTSQDVKGRFSMVGKRKRRYLDGCGRIIAARTSKAEDQL